MNDSAMRESLLEQSTATSATVNMLNQMAEVEERRARRLKLWARGVGVAWVVSLVLAFGSGEESVVLMVLAPLTVLGVILLIAQWGVSRAVTISRLRANVASIEEQLRALSAKPAASSGDSEPQGDS